MLFVSPEFYYSGVCTIRAVKYKFQSRESSTRLLYIRHWQFARTWREETGSVAYQFIKPISRPNHVRLQKNVRSGLISTLLLPVRLLFSSFFPLLSSPGTVSALSFLCLSSKVWILGRSLGEGSVAKRFSDMLRICGSSWGKLFEVGTWQGWFQRHVTHWAATCCRRRHHGDSCDAGVFDKVSAAAHLQCLCAASGFLCHLACRQHLRTAHDAGRPRRFACRRSFCESEARAAAAASCSCRPSTESQPTHRLGLWKEGQKNGRSTSRVNGYGTIRTQTNLAGTRQSIRGLVDQFTKILSKN